MPAFMGTKKQKNFRAKFTSKLRRISIGFGREKKLGIFFEQLLFFFTKSELFG